MHHYACSPNINLQIRDNSHFAGCLWSLEVFVEVVDLLQLALIQELHKLTLATSHILSKRWAHLKDGIASRSLKQNQHLCTSTTKKPRGYTPDDLYHIVVMLTLAHDRGDIMRRTK